MKPRNMYTEELSALETASRLGERAGSLNRRQASVLRMRSEGLSTGAVGVYLGVSRQRVHQIEQRAVEILQQEGLLDGTIYRTAGQPSKKSGA